MDLTRPLALQASDVDALKRLKAPWVRPLHWEPVGKLLEQGYSERWGVHRAAAIGSLVGGSHWPQARLHAHGKA
eukprot:1353894-Pyramimonas_sp.AAC.1